MLEIFRKMVNECIRIGLRHNVSAMKRLCQLSYRQLAKYNALTYYKLCAISRAAGILANRKKSINRGYCTKDPYVKKPILISCYGFKIVNGTLRIPLGDGHFFNIPLNNYVKVTLASESSVKIRSFTLTSNCVSMCYTKQVKQEIPCSTIDGIDRNLENLTVGNCQSIIQYNLSKAVQIASNTREIVKSFKRNDVRIRKQIAAKYGQRRKNRVNQLLHKVSKCVVERAKQERKALAFEDIRHIRKLYRRGNFYQGRGYRAKMNSWPFHEIKRQIEYKAAWEGIPVIKLTKGETRGSSQLCPQCGKRAQVAKQDDKWHQRQLWCSNCKKWMDRDVAAATNLSIKGWQRFCHSQGAADEAMVQELGSKEPIILKVDAAKLNPRRMFEQRRRLFGFKQSVTDQTLGIQ